MDNAVETFFITAFLLSMLPMLLILIKSQMDAFKGKPVRQEKLMED